MFLTDKRWILFFLLIANSSATWAIANWSMTSSFVRDSARGVAYHQLDFANAGGHIIYTPPTPPFGLVNQQVYEINGTRYFVTGWAHGPATVLYRVFAPPLNLDQPLCEVASLAERATLRGSMGGVQIAVRLNPKGDLKWIDCRDRS